MLWTIGALLAALALAFTVWPLLRPHGPRGDVPDRGRLMRVLYRDRLAELDREAAAGQLDPQIRSEVVDELGANLLDEYREAEWTAADPAGAGRPGRRAAWIVAALVPVLALGVYLTAGEPDAVSIAGASQVLELDPQDQRAEIEQWRDALEKRVSNRPDDAQSWYLLGVSRLQLGEFATAAEAFASAHELTGADPNIDLYWLQARYLAADGQMDERSRAIAQRVLERRPNHPLVLEMFAIDAYRGERYREAVEHLNRALNNPLSAHQFAALLGGLEQARSRMGNLAPSVDVRVTAPPQAPREGTLFVIARPPGGGMPYAVIRRPAGMLPLEVRLDDTTAMNPQLELSAAGQFQVVVRLSRSGRPTPGPGDWEWQSEVLEVDALSEPATLEATLAPRADGAT